MWDVAHACTLDRIEVGQVLKTSEVNISTSIRMLLVAGVLAMSVMSTRAESFTAINVDSGEPSLFYFLDTVYGEGNYERISDDVDNSWTAEAIIRATAIGSTASARQQLGACVVCDGSDNLEIGSVVTASGVLSTLLFDGEFAYAGQVFRWFDAASGDPAVGAVYSDPLLNASGTDHMVSFAITNQPGVFVIAFEDWLSTYEPKPSDRDFNDFIVELQLTGAGSGDLIDTPEPTTITLLGGALLVLGLGLRQRRGGVSG